MGFRKTEYTLVETHGNLVKRLASIFDHVETLDRPLLAACMCPKGLNRVGQGTSRPQGRDLLPSKNPNV